VAVTLTLALLKLDGDWQERTKLEALFWRNILFLERLQVMPVGLETWRLSPPPMVLFDTKPLMLVAVIVEVPAVLTPVVTLDGLALNEKS
jgi:hypothetical protein